MGKCVDKVLEPPASSDSADHVALEDLARLTDGTVEDGERERLLHHINRCQRCYEILHQTLKDATPAGASPAADYWWKTKTAYALAASIVLIFIICGQFAYQYWSSKSDIITATLNLDQNLKDILLEDDALQFGRGPRLSRLLAVLQQSGLPVGELKRAVLTTPYYQKKSLFGPREVLQIRIEGDTVYLTVKEAD